MHRVKHKKTEGKRRTCPQQYAYNMDKLCSGVLHLLRYFTDFLMYGYIFLPKKGSFLSLTISLLEAFERKSMASKYKGTVGIIGKNMPTVPSIKKERPKNL